MASEPSGPADELRAAMVAARPSADAGVARDLGLRAVLGAVLGKDPGRPAIDRFLLEREVGRGGMGIVYRAHDRETGETVAVKLLEGATGGASDADRFVREARLLAELGHPAIVRHVAHGRTPAGELYLAMEWLEGEDLGARLRRGGLSVEDAVRLAIRVAEALAAAHARAIVHRDLKPANVFLPGGELAEAKLLDFGVARPGTSGVARLTGSGVLVGTPSYMAPEQVRGQAVDARADLFALGCLLSECLVGRPTFAAEHVLGVLARVLFEDAPSVASLRADVPAALDALIVTLLAKEPSGRPASAAAVAEALRALGPLAGAAAAATPAATTLSMDEQRVVSVVLIDHPEIASAPGDGELRAIATSFGASLERVTGGTLVAALARGPAVDQAAAAARMALAMAERLPRASIAVATGRGDAGGVVPVGEAIDRAGKLLAARGAGVWVDGTTGALLQGRFELAGGARLVGALDDDHAARTLLGRPTPCVGREHELALLDAALADCVERPNARLVLVTAPPGVGKSRLAGEWARRLAARDRPPRVLACRGEPTSAGAPFLLAAQLVRRATGVPEGAPATEQRAALARALGDRVRPADLPRLVTFLGELVGVPQEGGGDELRAARGSALLMGDQIRLAWEDLLQLETAAGPVVLLVEDLHWGDAPSVSLFAAALRSLEERPLLVVAFGRPEIHELFPSLWGARGGQAIRLPELSRRASEELARAALGPTDPETVAWICERAGGHALYLEEIIRAVAEGKRASVPPSAVAMVQARLAGLPAEARRLLRGASVFGEVFWRGGVAALIGRDARGLGEIFEELVQRETISDRRSSRFPGETEYTFRHALFREAALAMLTDADRALGHRLAAEWLLGAGERRPLVLAEHLERGGDAARAAEWYVQAAEEALAGNDFAGALERATRGLTLAEAGVLRGRLRLVQAEAHRWRGEEADAERCALEASELLEPGSARWYTALRVALTRLPARRALVDRVTLLLSQAPGAGHAATSAFVMAAVAASVQLAFHGERELGWSLVEQAEALAALLPPTDVAQAWRLRARASMLEFEGRHDAALEANLAASRSFEAVGDLREACSLSTAVGWLQATELGLHEEAVRTLRQSLELARRMGLVRAILAAEQNLGAALLRLGQLDEARRRLEETGREFGRASDARMEAGSRFYLILLHTRRGDLERAEAEALTALELAREVPTTRACALAALARVLLGAGRPGEALERARAAQALLDELGGVEEGEAMIRLALAEALEASGLTPEARAAIEVARARLRERAGRIGDPRVKRAFLEDVPEHARTQALAEEWRS